jgi:hypothetical protein
MQAMTAGDAARADASPATTPSAWYARAFGVDLALDFESPALRRCEQEAAQDPTVLVLVPDDAIASRWEGAGRSRLGGMADADGSVLLDIREDRERGILFEAAAHGRYLIESGHRRVLCAPADEPAWHWQRMLVGQVLPLVAALRGLHVLHASVVEIGGRAIALSGMPGTGKSTLALELALRGHGILAEDVVALHVEGGRAVAEPGVALVNLRPTGDAEAAIERGGLAVLGRSHKIHVDLPRSGAVLPLDALLLLEPAAPGAGELRVLPEPSLPELAQTSFVPYLERPEDLFRHLELCATIARSATVALVAVDRTEPATALADRIEAFAEALA